MDDYWRDLDFLRQHCHTIHAFGLGFVQIKLTFGARIHLYTQQVQQTTEPEDVHDHRYGFISTVVQGRLINELWQAIPDPSGEFELHEVTCKPGNAGDERPLGACRLERTALHTLPAGASYEMERDTFHRVTADEGTITRLSLDTPSKTYARVARLKDNPAVCPFSANTFTEDELWAMYGAAVCRKPPEDRP